MSYGKITLIALLPVIIALGCEPEGGQAKNTDRDDSDDWGDTDTDTDIDTDTDSDSDTDMDSDSDGEGKDDNGCDKMDILFVIDNSGSMIEEQNNLIQNFPQFIQVLEDYRTPAGTQLTYRVGVIDTSKKVTVNMKMPGFPTPIPEPMPGSSGALKTVQGSGQKWIEGPGADVSSQFSNIARVGTNGSGFEMPLEVARLAFSEREEDGTNAGFRHEDGTTLSVLVFITDEDDCSHVEDTFECSMLTEDCCFDENTHPVEDYYNFFNDLYQGKERWAAIVVAGPVDCSSGFGDAIAAVRMQRFIDMVGNNGVFADICSGDLAQGLQEGLEKMMVACDELTPLE